MNSVGPQSSLDLAGAIAVQLGAIHQNLFLWDLFGVHYKFFERIIAPLYPDAGLIVIKPL
jgi:hypothetical protein